MVDVAVMVMAWSRPTMAALAVRVLPSHPTLRWLDRNAIASTGIDAIGGVTKAKKTWGSEVAVSCRRDGSRTPNEAPGTLGTTIRVASPLERAGVMGGSNVSLHVAGVVGTGLTSVEGHADCPTGTAGVPGTESAAVAPILHAAAGPDSWHFGWPAGRLNRASLSTATALMQLSTEQEDWVGLKAGTARTV